MDTNFVLSGISKMSLTEYHNAVDTLAAKAFEVGLIDGVTAQTVMTKAREQVAVLAKKSAASKAKREAKKAVTEAVMPESYVPVFEVMKATLAQAENPMTGAEINAAAGTDFSALKFSNVARHKTAEGVFVISKNPEGRTAYSLAQA